MIEKIELFGHNNCPNCKVIKDYLKQKHIKFDYVDIFNDTNYAVDCGIRSVPTLIIDEQIFINPSMEIVKNNTHGDLK